MKKKLIFKKGTDKIVFPCFRPIGSFDFDKEAEKQIGNIQRMYKPRKDVHWEFSMSSDIDSSEVTARKNYYGKCYGFPVFVTKPTGCKVKPNK
jgi:hypothetical protein